MRESPCLTITGGLDVPLSVSMSGPESEVTLWLIVVMCTTLSVRCDRDANVSIAVP
jgi:hypothetical protein